MQQTLVLPSFYFVNRTITSESLKHERFGDVRSYRLAKKLLKSEEKADEFMLSDLGGYTMGQLEAIKYQINRTKKGMKH